MGRVDVINNVAVFDVLPKIDRNATATIQGASVAGYHGAGFIIDCGAHTSGGGFDVKFQHRDGSDAWEDIPAGQLYGDATANDVEIRSADANTRKYVGYAGNKEQIGAVLTRDTTGIMVVGVKVVAGSPSVIPPNNR